MRPKLLLSLGTAVGSACCTAIYQLVEYGAFEIDWARVLFVAVVTFAAVLLVPLKWAETIRR